MSRADATPAGGPYVADPASTCPRCGYHLDGVVPDDGRCPRCDAVVVKPARTTPRRPAGPRRRLSIRDLLSEGFEAFKTAPGVCVAMACVNGAIFFGGSLVATAIAVAITDDDVGTQVVQTVLGVFPQAIAGVFFSRVLLGVLRRGKPFDAPAADVVEMLPSMVLDIAFVQLCAVFLLGAPIAVLVACVLMFGPLSLAASLPLVLLGYWNFLLVTANGYLTGFTIADPAIRCRGVTALRRTWALSSGHRGKLVVLMFVTGFLVLCGFLALGVGALVAVPVAHLTWAAAYNRLVIFDGERMLAEFAVDAADEAAEDAVLA
ncbi:MAG: hypothetical protein AAF532_08575 [Planctomycetota bacterium]